MEKRDGSEESQQPGYRRAVCTCGRSFTVSGETDFRCPACFAYVRIVEPSGTRTVKVGGVDHRQVAEVAEKLASRAARQEKSEFPKWAQVAGLCAGVVTLLFMMGLVVASTFGHQVPQSSRFFVNSVLSLGVALTFAFIGGDAAAKGRLPVPGSQDHPVEFSVAGGVAVFVIILLIASRLSM